MLSRIRKPGISIRGPKKAFRDATLFYIACEGEKTEFQYFNFSFLRNSRIQLHVIPAHDGRSAPTHVLENLKVYLKSKTVSSSDRLWLVIDKDRWPASTQLHAIQNQKIKKIPINMGV